MLLSLITQLRFNLTFDAWLSKKKLSFYHFSKLEMLEHAMLIKRWAEKRKSHKSTLVGALARYINGLTDKDYKNVEDITFALLVDHESTLVFLEYIRLLDPQTFNIILINALGNKKILENKTFKYLNTTLISEWINSVFKHGILNNQIQFLNRLNILMRHQHIISVINTKWDENSEIIKSLSLITRYIYQKEDRFYIEKHWAEKDYAERISMIDGRFLALGIQIEDINPYYLAKIIFPEHPDIINLAELTESNPYTMIKTMTRFGAPVDFLALPVLT